MERTPVTSSNLASIGYDDDASALEIEFKAGGLYRYNGVSSATHSALMAADSHGKYFMAHIRNRYETVKLS